MSKLNILNVVNILEISHETALQLLIDKWMDIQNKQHPKMLTCFVGDIHGDFNQLLAPLILTSTIKLTGRIVNMLPEYEYLNSSTKIIYLGDYVDGWIFSRHVVMFLAELFKLHNPKNIILIFGNHDLSYIGRYKLFKLGGLNFEQDIPSGYEIYKDELKTNPSLTEFEYLTPIFNSLWYLFENNHLKLCDKAKINGLDFIISHNTWTKRGLKELYDAVSGNLEPKINRPGDKNPIQQERFKQFDKNISSDNYNELFKMCPYFYIARNKLTYMRNTEDIIFNQIVGHTIGAEWAKYGINSEPSITNEERRNKLNPKIINDKYIFYFDFGSTPEYNSNNQSKPDFVYISQDSKIQVTNLPIFEYYKTSDDVINLK